MSSPEKALETLDTIWEEIQRLPRDEIEKKSFVENRLRNTIKRLVNAETKAFRYAVLTQVLAKVINPQLNCLSLQKKAGFSGSFDARSFCKDTVVQFEREKLDNILGASGDPYVSKPLRHEAITLDITEHIKKKQEWRDLYETLRLVEDKPELASGVLKQILLEIRANLEQKVIQPPSIPSIGMEQLKEILVSYLAKPSGGARPQAIAYAFFKIFNEKTKAFANVTTAKVTAADIFAGRFADIECRDQNGNLKLAVGVTDTLDAKKLEDELQKAVTKNIKNLLVVAHRIRNRRLNETIRKYNINTAILELIGFINTMSIMLNNEMRQKLVLEIYSVLRELEYRDHLREWDKLIREELSYLQI